MRRALPFWAALVFSLGFGLAALAQTYPGYKDVYVDDFAGLLTASQKSDLRAELVDLYDKTGIEAVIVTMDTMRKYGHSGPIEPFATGLFNAWGVGNAKLDNGVLVLVAKNDRQMRIELGLGFPPSLDAEMQTIIDIDMLPEFRKGNYATGILAGTHSLVQTLEAGAGVAKPLGLMDQAKRRFRNFSASLLTILTIVGLAALAGSFRLYQFWRRNQPRHCPVDGTDMYLMTEDADDGQLQQGQTIEERLGSVDYDVWHCAKCQHVTIESYRRWLSRYGACRACNYRTLEGTTTVLRSATTSESGLKRIDYHCHNCSENWSETRTIAQLSSSGSSRSSFGGGRSGGGGASGRW